MAIDRDAWLPPAPPVRGAAGDVPGAMGGSRLWDQPAQAEQRAQLDAFVARPPPLAVEIGFDHGINLLDHARAFPDMLWLGAELRRHRVAVVAENAPDNCLPMRADGRVLVACLLPQHRVARLDIYFPTPAIEGQHLLWTPRFVADCARVLRPDGVLQLVTDVPALFTLAQGLLQHWLPTEAPPTTGVLSRRARICRRDAVPVHQLAVRPPR